jgi:hypothetical protein
MFTATSSDRGRSSRLGRTPEPDTPYRQAQQLWDSRMGSSLAHARTWRTAAFASLWPCRRDGGRRRGAGPASCGRSVRD